MPLRKSKEEAGTLKRAKGDAAPAQAVAEAGLRGRFRFRYTTGPFLLPQDSGSLDWALLNDDNTAQKARVTVFQCPIGTAKTALPPGPLVVSVQPGECTHNANTYPEGFLYEIVVECNSKLLFPYVSVWPGNFGVVIPGTGINSGTFLAQMP